MGLCGESLLLKSEGANAQIEAGTRRQEGAIQEELAEGGDVDVAGGHPGASSSSQMAALSVDRHCVIMNPHALRSCGSLSVAPPLTLSGRTHSVMLPWHPACWDCCAEPSEPAGAGSSRDAAGGAAVRGAGDPRSRGTGPGMDRARCGQLDRAWSGQLDAGAKLQHYAGRISKGGHARYLAADGQDMCRAGSLRSQGVRAAMAALFPAVLLA